MTKEQAIEKLKQQQEISDIELAHSHADGILCDFLKSLGFEDVVSEWEKVEKWYA